MLSATNCRAIAFQESLLLLKFANMKPQAMRLDRPLASTHHHHRSLTIPNKERAPAIHCNAGPQKHPSTNLDTNHSTQLAHVDRRQLFLGTLAAAAALITSPLGPTPSTANAASGPHNLTLAQREAIDRAFAATFTKAKAPVMLRLVFHDAGTFDAAAGNGGANASIALELERPENFGLKRGWTVIEQTYEQLKGTPAEGVVSKADLIALAGAHAVSITGGPSIDVPVGRKDATQPDPEDRLPAETLSATDQLAIFALKSISAQEMVALLGSHTVRQPRFLFQFGYSLV